LKAYSFSLGSEKDSGIALTAACELHGGQSPDAVFLCAGKSTPGFFIEQDEHSLKQGMEDGYWVQAFPALVGCSNTAIFIY
jgi:3-dehydrosphinganine reductase